MANENCLHDIACPNCGSDVAFRIQASVLIRVVDSGVEDAPDSMGNGWEWDETSYISCVACDHNGKVADFRVKTDGDLVDAVSELVAIDIGARLSELHEDTKAGLAELAEQHGNNLAFDLAQNLLESLDAAVAQRISDWCADLGGTP